MYSESLKSVKNFSFPSLVVPDKSVPKLTWSGLVRLLPHKIKTSQKKFRSFVDKYGCSKYEIKSTYDSMILSYI